MMSVEMVGKIVVNTPVWVWVLLIFLIKKGLEAKCDRVVSMKKAVLLPGIFILLGLQQIVADFHYSAESLVVYFLLLVIGIAAGMILYSRTQQYYFNQGVLMRKGSGVSLVVSLLNFMVRYGLTAAKSVDAGLLSNLLFNVASAAVSGFSVGLFIGGMMYMIKAKKELEGTYGMA